MSNTKSVLLTILLNLSMSTVNAIESSTQKNVLVGIVGIATIVLIEKLFSTIYHNYVLHNSQIINHCAGSFKKIDALIHTCKNRYVLDATLSNWELAERICTTYNKSPQPFLAYHSHITAFINELQLQLDNLTTSLKDIRYKQMHSMHEKTTAKNKHFLNTLRQLNTHGTDLIKELKKMIAILSLLKERIALLSEYNEDYEQVK